MSINGGMRMRIAVALLTGTTISASELLGSGITIAVPELRPGAIQPATR